MKKSVTTESSPSFSVRLRRSWFVLLPLVLALGAWVRIQDLNFDTQSSLNRSPDEPIYTAYASVLAHEGLKKGTEIAVRQYIDNEKLQGYPTPTRVGYLYPLALWMRFSNRFDIDIGLYFSCAASILSLLLLAGIGLRFFNPWIALCACIFMAFSPLELALARKVWQDSLMALTGGALLWFCLEILHSPKKWSLLGFGLAGAYACLSKESGAVLFGLYALWLAIIFLSRRDLKNALILSAVFLISFMCVFLFLSYLAGGTGNIIELFRQFTRSLPNNEYVVRYQTGPWYALPQGFFILTPTVTLLALSGLLAALFEKRISWATVAFIFTAFMVAASVPQYFKNLRFLSPVYMPYFLLSGTGIYFAASAIFAKLKRQSLIPLIWFLTLLVVLIAWMDRANFEKRFIQEHTKDLVNALLSPAGSSQ